MTVPPNPARKHRTVPDPVAYTFVFLVLLPLVADFASFCVLYVLLLSGLDVSRYFQPAQVNSLLASLPLSLLYACVVAVSHGPMSASPLPATRAWDEAFRGEGSRMCISLFALIGVFLSYVTMRMGGGYLWTWRLEMVSLLWSPMGSG